MRRVDAEGESRGIQGRKGNESPYKTRLRKADLEWLESREMLSTSTSTLPAPAVVTAPAALAKNTSISHSTAALNLTANPSANTPSVAVDPLDSSKMVAVWINQDLAGFNRGNFVAPITSYAEGAFSTDGGKTWNAINAFGPNSANVQIDFSLTFPTNGTINVFTQTTDASVAFDRNGNFYLLTSTHDAAAADGTSTAGVLDLQRFSFTGGSPTLQTPNPTVVYAWDKPDSGTTYDPAVTPVLAVDSNLASFTDPTTNATVTDPFAGNIYVVWASVDSNTFGGIPSFNPNTIRMATSNNQGVNFTAPAYVDNSSNANNYNSPVVTNPPSNSAPLHDSTARYVEPQVTISQGNGTVPGGQLSIVYDDYGSQAPINRILVQSNTVGGASENFSIAGSTPNFGTQIPITVNITDPAFTTLSKLDITASIFWPNLSEIGAKLFPPTAVNNFLLANVPGYQGFIDLFEGNIGAQSGTADSSGNLGVGSSGQAVGTVFDPAAIRSITDGNAKGGAVGYYQPISEAALAALKGLTAAQLNGTWNFESDILKADTSTNPKIINNVSLNFTSGNDPGAPTVVNGQLVPNPEVAAIDKNTLYLVNIPGINPTNTNSLSGFATHTDNPGSLQFDGIYGSAVGGNGNIVTAAQATPILPQPVLASDNTLGSFSAHSGRIYLSFTGMFSNAQAGNTDIFLLSSDDGGKTWTPALQVNDDNAATDGYSASVAGGSLGRTQYAPQLQVDQSTGDVVLSFFDTRNDPTGARVSTYIAASNDGGNTFAAETYANPTATATDAITGAKVNLGPVPDNQSAAGTVQDVVGYGIRQALAVINGQIIAFWASNQNTATKLQIVNSFLSLTAGPRIIASTQGPVGGSSDTLNTTRAADGTPIANSIRITFSEPVDPTATIAALLANTSVFYKSPNGGTSLSLPVTNVVATAGTALGATQFQITFDPSTVLSTFNTFVGTYSYAIKPNGISDRIRHTNANGIVVNGNVMDQNANGTTGESATPVGGPFTNIGDTYVVGQPGGFSAYAAGTLPLIVPGPSLIATQAVNLAGTVISSGTNNLVLNNTVSAIDLTFDRNMQVSSFTLAEILAIYGPAGAIPLTGITITPVSFFSGGSQVPYAGGGLADVFKVTFPIQQLSGTYALTLDSGLLAADGSAMNASKTAGLDVLRGTATNGVTIPVSYPSTATPLAITAGSVATPSVLMAPITVPNDFPIQGDVGSVAGLTLTLDISYPVDPNLIAYLLAPDGVTKINLFTKVGTGTNTANFSTTTLSDTANTLISNAGAPFFGSFKPEQPLANLAGMVSQGTWNLVIQNLGSATGTLNSWSLTFQKPVSSTGLGEVDDRSTANFQIFNLAPSNALANSTWTAVGPAGVTVSTDPNTGTTNPGTFAGAVSTLAVDPSDPSGNTVYVGSASGGIWKTTNFLTTNPAGPTYQPLTDFGPNFSLNIGSIAAFGVNDNPSQTVLFAGTGFGQSTTSSTAGYPNVDLNAGGGVGILRSTDGGVTWTLLDSLTNVDSSGAPLAESLRDHTFIGSTTFKIIVDPTPELNGQIIVYAALGGPNGGLYRSLDSGNHWTLMSGAIGGPATDVILDPNSKSPTTGNLDVLYAAFPNKGVFVSSNQAQTLSQMTGQLGKDPLLVNPGFPATPINVGDSGVSPNGASGTIVLGKPSLTNSVSENIDYQGWLYAAVENPNGTFQGLYVTKDNGGNWTQVQLPNIPGTGSVKAAVPTNNNIDINSYDPTSSQFSQQGNYDLTLTVDPTNPNIVYIGGTSNFQQSGLIRVDLTNLRDAQNFTSFSNSASDGGQLFVNGTGGVVVNTPTNGPASYLPIGAPPSSNYLNLRYAPNNGTLGTSPFSINATLVLANVSSVGFVNDGTGATWSLFDEPLKANAGDTTGSTNLHDAIAYVDPLTGDVRMLFANDQGVFTALVNPDGTLSNGIGTAVEPNYSRNGNLQNEQFFSSAAQPSSASSQAAGALFYASGQSNIADQSGSNVLTSGNLTWDNSQVVNPSPTSPLNTAANNSISTSDRMGVGVATDPTGATHFLYQFDVPILGGNLTDFFRVNNFGQTTGLVNNVGAEFPQQGTRASGTTGADLAGAVANGLIPLGNFAVNPLNGNQILIGSATGRLYETTNQGILWFPVGTAANFDGSQLSAIAYGAPDPNAPGGVGNLNNFVYVGTSGSVGGTQGHIFITQAGGQGWTNISSGLDGASIVGIYPDPNRGSHAAYAVTLTGVFYSPDTVGLAAAGQTVWTSITNNLTAIQRNPFGNATYQQSVLAGFQSNSGTGNQGTTLYGGFSSILADYRYLIPSASNTPGGTNNVFFPVLYVSGYGGVFRSIDNGTTWTVFPNTAFDAAPVDGGYLPSVDVTNLQLVLGNINPATGHAVQTTGDPEILLATTYGRGDFAIRLAPDVFPSTISLDQTLPPPNGSDSGAVRGFPNYTNVQFPYIDGTSEVSNYGNTVTITLFDQTNGDVIGTGTTDAFGQFSIQVASTVATTDPSFLLDGLKTIGIQATDSSGASGNVVVFTYNLKATPPANPTNLTLTNDSGRVNNDNISRLLPPTFTVGTTEPTTTAVELVRLALGSLTNYEVVDTVAAGTSTVNLTDNLLVSELNGSTIMQSITYYVIQVDLANNYSTPLANITTDPSKLSVFLDNVLPAAPNSPTLDPSTNSGTDKSANITNSTNPLFNVTGLLTTGPVSPYNLELFRSFGGSTPILVGTAAPGATQIRDTLGIPTVNGTTQNGVYVYFAAQVDLAGNVSPLSQGQPITINTTAPAVPTLFLYSFDDSGAPTHPNVTNVTSPRFNGTGTANLPIVLYNQATGQGLASATVSANGSYLLQIIGPVADGTYTLVAKITNSAGNSSTSAPLTVTIKHAGPQIVPTLSLLPADDTGIKGDGVTANHTPRFTGTTDKGNQVTLYSLVNGVLSAPQATTTASSVNGSFTFQLPFSLTDGTTQLVAESTDIAGNNGTPSSPLTVRIISVAGDYYGTGTANLTVFNPSTQTYVVRNAGSVTVDTTPGYDVPVQYDFNGTGSTDPVAYRYYNAQYYGSLMGSGTPVNYYYGQPGVALPIPGYYGGYGTFINANYNPQTAVWSIALPQAGGFVIQYGAPNIDIPVPAAYDGNGVTEIATFRPSAVGPVTPNGSGADSFNVAAFNGPAYQVSFTSPAVTKLGFVYKPGDIPAPADYAGIGKDQFAIYRPSTGQFFILNTPDPRNSATWTLKTVTLNLPGGPNASDVPVSEDYDGNGMVDPAVYRPSNSTFYLIHSSTGIQQNIQFGTPAGSIAAAGPLLYRLSALQGIYATGAGYPAGVGGRPPGSVTGFNGGGGGTLGGFHIESVASANTSSSTSSSSSANSLPVSSMIAVATPLPITTAVTQPIPNSGVNANLSGSTVNSAVTVGASTPRSAHATAVHGHGHGHATKASHKVKTIKEKAEPVKKSVTVATKAHAVKVHTTAEHSTVNPTTTTTTKQPASVTHPARFAAAAMVLQKLVHSKKGHQTKV